MKPRLRGGSGPLGAIASWHGDEKRGGGRTLIIIEEFRDAADCIFRYTAVRNTEQAVCTDSCPNSLLCLYFEIHSVTDGQNVHYT